ncbi:MAG: hypothetical protein IKO07_11110, partial [Clostridia bacterium]|nr:hypothetical protein [Clostridia bacterium]
LRVANDGAPFDPESAPGAKEGHFGLEGMRQRALRLGARLPPCPPVEEAVRLEQLEADLTAALHALPGAKRLRPALEFSLLEESDQLYRFANLLDAEQERPAESVVGGRMEITPGRPCVAAHRHPLDAAFRPLDFDAAPQGAALALALMAPLERLIASRYAARAAEAADPLARALFAEMALIEEQHAAQYESLWDPRPTPLHNLALRTRALGYLYHSLLAAETDASLRALWQEHLDELRGDMLAISQWPEGAARASEPFPPPFLFGDTAALVRALMPRQATLTMLEDSLVPAEQLPGGCRYFDWQRALCGDGADAPSHRAVARYAARYGTDYRFERRPSPIEALQNRRLDNTTLGRERVVPDPAR